MAFEAFDGEYEGEESQYLEESIIDSDAVGLDLSNERLLGIDMRAADLSHANLSNSFIAGANLKGANLANAAPRLLALIFRALTSRAQISAIASGSALI